MATRSALIARRLRDEGGKMLGFFRSLGPGDWERQVYPRATAAGDEDGPSWDLRCLLCHQLSAERGFHELATNILDGGEGAAEGMDIDEYNAVELSSLLQEPPARLVDALAAARQANIELVLSLGDQDFDLEGRHPYFGRATLEKLFKLIYRHNMLHLRDARRMWKKEPAAGGGDM